MVRIDRPGIVGLVAGDALTSGTGVPDCMTGLAIGARMRARQGKTGQIVIDVRRFPGPDRVANATGGREY